MKTSKIITAACMFAPLVGFAQHATLLTTFTNPTPAIQEYFGFSIAAVGNDRVLIGASHDNTGATNAGAAYLFSANGPLLTTFTNPTPALSDWFGHSVAAVGNESALIGADGDDTGATDAGAAYLFNSNGTLLTTFTNPTPTLRDWFGRSVAAVGNDRVLIGAYEDDTGAFGAGAAYLFSTNGTLLTTFANPTPAVSDWFGFSVAALGNDRVLIGAPNDRTGATNAGAAYLLSTNGALLTTFTNPTPATFDYFGHAVAALGDDGVLIGAWFGGVAYLFSTNGTLLTTFTNPTAATTDLFGYSVIAVGNDRVLIGSPGDKTGAAYLFRTNGTLLTAFTNHTPALNDYFGFGSPVAALGSDRVLIGYYFDDTGASAAGAAYLFLIQPRLTIGRTTTNTVAISWPSPSTGFALQQNTNGIETVNWSNVTDTIQDDGTNRSLTVPAFTTGHRFYRLQK